jgi:hypothetical protein
MRKTHLFLAKAKYTRDTSAAVAGDADRMKKLRLAACMGLSSRLQLLADIQHTSRVCVMQTVFLNPVTWAWAFRLCGQLMAAMHVILQQGL